MKKKYFNTGLNIGFLIALLTVTGCAEYHRRVLDNTPEKGPQFTRALAKEYERLGKVEEDDMFDQWSANYYFCKAIAAKEGCCVAPTCLTRWRLPEKKVPELAAARQRLMEALDSGARKIAPRLAARAQAYFDCWVEQQEEEWQLKDIAACRYDFYASIAEVEFLLMGGLLHVMPNYSILFSLDSAKLNHKSIQILDEIAKENKSRHILLVGRTDRLGESKYNKTLARHRALAVKKELVRRGFPPHLVTVKSGIVMFGPKVNAHDRRVDVIFLK